MHFEVLYIHTKRFAEAESHQGKFHMLSVVADAMYANAPRPQCCCFGVPHCSNALSAQLALCLPLLPTHNTAVAMATIDLVFSISYFAFNVFSVEYKGSIK